MSDTPETDAAINSQAGWKRPFVSITSNGTTYDGPLVTLCRKLECERDDLRDRLNEILNPPSLKHPHETGGGGMGTLLP
jgi:hypothetical protein